MIAIRQANAADIPWLLTQLRQFDRFFGAKHSLFPDETVAVEKVTALMDPDVGCFYVATGEGIRVTINRLIKGGVVADDTHEESTEIRLGFIAGLLGPQFFNPAITQLTELLWWVAPEYRGGSAGARLLEAFTQYGREHARWIAFTLEENSPVNPASLERRGYRLHERSYLLEVEDPCVSTIGAVPAGCSGRA